MKESAVVAAHSKRVTKYTYKGAYKTKSGSRVEVSGTLYTLSDDAARKETYDRHKDAGTWEFLSIYVEEPERRIIFYSSGTANTKWESKATPQQAPVAVQDMGVNRLEINVSKKYAGDA